MSSSAIGNEHDTNPLPNLKISLLVKYRYLRTALTKHSTCTSDLCLRDSDTDMNLPTMARMQQKWRPRRARDCRDTRV